MLSLSHVLTPDDLQAIHEDLVKAPFTDGKLTAGPTARRVKSNLQAVGADPLVRDISARIRKTLDANDTFRLYARPIRWSHLILSRYGEGDAYGAHVDDPVMLGENGLRLRTDLSFTLFLSDPTTYDGGELLIETAPGQRLVKLEAGGLVVYPSGDLHRVEPVKAGERLACVGWIQSLIRREDQRELLFDLSRVKGQVADGDARLLVDRAVANLLRMWGET